MVDNFFKITIFMSFKLESMRRFSTAFKKEKVDLILKKKLTVREVSKIYNVSDTAVYKWLHKFGNVDKSERIVIEKISETAKSKDLLKLVERLESELGHMYLENVLQSKIIECGSELLGEDLKKKYYSRR